MPVKAGPNGTLRQYSSITGRYVKEGISNPYARPMSKGERKYIRKVNKQYHLLQKACASTDPYLLDTFEFIENRFPFITECVNEKVYLGKTERPREFDIITHRHVIEIKSGQKPGA